MRILLFTQYSLPDHKQNMNAYQRVYYGSRHAEIHLLIRKGHSVSEELHTCVTVHQAPVGNRVQFFLYALVLGLWLRLKGVNIVLTEPSRFAWVGWVLKHMAGYFWAMDIWDPVWKENPAKSNHITWIDRLTFGAMERADLFILSCLPPAAKHIRLTPERCAQFCNAIELAGVVAATSPPREPGADTLHLALARARLGRKEGCLTVLKAAEEVQAAGARVKIHLVGNLESDIAKLLAESPAQGLFEVHGIIQEARTEFFKTIHVGLVPYEPIEDMCHIFPIKVLEHLSQGNVVIASSLPGLAATIKHEYNGLLFEPGNSHELAESILRLYGDYSLWKRLSASALVSVRRYDPAVKNAGIFEEIRRRTARCASKEEVCSAAVK